MPRVYPSCIVSFSSEDPNHPSCNLLKKESFRKWKCREVGENEAIVIFKMDKVEVFNGFNICNDNSAFIEIFVARSGANPVKYESILSQTQLMSPTESRNGENTNSVRFFQLHQLNKVTAVEKWDLVKVVCCQPFNRHVQYGLSFIEFNTAPDPNEKQKFGMFGLRAAPLGNTDEFSPIVVGSLFNKLKRSSDEGSSSALTMSRMGKSNDLSSDVLTSSTTLADATIAASEKKIKELIRKRKLDANSNSSEPGHSGSKRQSFEGSGQSPWNKKESISRPRDTLVGSSQNSNSNRIADQSPSSSIGSPTALQTFRNKQNENGKVSPSAKSSVSSISSKKPDTVTFSAKPSSNSTQRKERAFDKLFEGVVFVMSGFENPYRTQLRNMALEMGAQFKGDWNSSSTHLLCAFANTPKFRQVKSSGRGKIVKKEWVEASYSAKCRFPWRRYCLDRDDKGQESEDEIYAVDEQVASQSVADSQSDRKSSEAEDEDEMEEAAKRKRKRVQLIVEDSESEEVNEEENTGEHTLIPDSESDDEAYRIDTDIDEKETE